VGFFPMEISHGRGTPTKITSKKTPIGVVCL